MGVKKFQRIALWLEWLLLFFSGLELLLIVPAVLAYLKIGGITFGFEPKFMLMTFSEARSSTGVAGDSEVGVILDAISLVLLLLVYSVIFYQGALIFRGLADGDSPFTQKFLTRLKRVSYVLIASSLFAGYIQPFLTRVILGMLHNDYNVVYGIQSSLIFGLMLYVGAGIIQYGIELQKLSDDVI
ncbi:hypothetical protein ACYSNU_00155 [Enterococcus sp. LJL120]